MKIMVIHSLVLLVLHEILPFCVSSCASDQPNCFEPKLPPWSLCVIRSKKNIQVKIVGLFTKKDNVPGWLAVGFPEANERRIDFEIIKRNASIIVKRTNATRKYPKCKYFPGESLPTVLVNCRIPKLKNSKTITIAYSCGKNMTDKVNKVGTNLKANNAKLTFDINQRVVRPKVKENAGSTAMKLLRNYGRSIAIIIGIALVLTSIISVTICCCCKKEKTIGMLKEKDVSVSFYKDNGEVEGDTDDSDTDEKVAFIRNNNGKNSNV